MITVTLTREEIAARATALAEYANRLAELADEEEGARARHKQLMADIKERRLEISGELRRLSRAVRLGVEERNVQRVLFDEEKRLEEFRRERADEGIEQQAEPTEEERERLHREAVATWRRERPATVEEEGEADEDYQAEWLAGLTDEERNRYYTAPCACGHERQWHGEEDRDTADRRCSLCKCEVYHCPACDTKRGHQASCDYYALGEGTPFDTAAVAQVINLDAFTAPRCSECGRIDGARTPECSKSGALTFDRYKAYAQAHYKRNWSSYARKMELNRDPEMDAKVREWEQQQADNSEPAAQLMPAGTLKEVEKKPRKKKGEKLSPVEAAIDR